MTGAATRANGRAAGAGVQRFDLDAAAKAAAAESHPVPFAFTYKGEDYDVPPAVQWPLEAQRLIGLGELDTALAMLLGQDQYEGLIAAGITVGDLTVLFEAIGKAAGVDGLPNLPQPVPPGLTRR
jgi:hypothetical protein